MDRVQVRRLASRWASGPLEAVSGTVEAVGPDVTARMDGPPVEDEVPTGDDYVCQLWAQGIDVEPLGLLARLEVELAPAVWATFYAVSCGHVVELRAGDTVVSEIVGAVARDPAASPVADIAATVGGAARSYQIGSLKVRTSVRVAELTPGRNRWLGVLGTDPGLRGRLLSVSTGEPRLVLWAPAGTTSVHSAHIFSRAGRMILTETSVQPC
jgi:hypothetical protein